MIIVFTGPVLFIAWYQVIWNKIQFEKNWEPYTNLPKQSFRMSLKMFICCCGLTSNARRSHKNSLEVTMHKLNLIYFLSSSKSWGNPLPPPPPPSLHPFSSGPWTMTPTPPHHTHPYPPMSLSFSEQQPLKQCLRLVKFKCLISEKHWFIPALLFSSSPSSHSPHPTLLTSCFFALPVHYSS